MLSNKKDSSNIMVKRVKNVRLLEKMVTVSGSGRMDLFISYHIIMLTVTDRIKMTKPKFMLFILPALYDILNALPLQAG